MGEPLKVTILGWILERINERGTDGLGGLTPKELEDLIRASDLNEAQRAVLLSRDPLRIRAVIEYELGYRVKEYMMHASTPFYFVLPIPMHLS